MYNNKNVRAFSTQLHKFLRYINQYPTRAAYVQSVYGVRGSAYIDALYNFSQIDNPSTKDIKKAVDTANKLRRYQYQYTSRAFEISEALGITGGRMLENLYERLDEVVDVL